MNRCLILLILGLALIHCLSAETVAQTASIAFPSQAAATGSEFSQSPTMGLLAQLRIRDGGAYLSWWKLLSIVVPFIVWVGLVDWINRDAMKIGEVTGLKPEAWNVVFVVTMLIGFFSGISIPIFVAGLPAYLLLAFFPPVLYFLLRRSRMKGSQNISEKVKSIKSDGAYVPTLEELPQDQGIKMTFKPAGDKNQQQVNLITARQTAGFQNLKEVLSRGIKSRADITMLDYTRDQVTIRMQVDGAWHALQPLDRVTGDAMLVSLKSLANLNPQERRYKQEGQFSLTTPMAKAQIDVISQGVQTGERVQVKYKRKAKAELTLNQLGMWPEMSAKLKKNIDSQGLAIISAPPSEGLTSSWRGALMETDRITRDCIAIVDRLDRESDVENIGIHQYDSTDGQSPASILKTLLLAQPDFLAVPTVANAKSLDALVHEANEENRSILTRTQAKSAAEALLRLFSASKQKEAFAQAATVVTCQRLFRRLCDKCRVEVQVQPKLIQQLGGDPRTQQTIFNPFKMPPPEQLIDEKGKPIEIPPCTTCAQLGYIGRIAAFEMIEVTDEIRKVMLTNPKIDAIEKIARKQGKLSIQSQAYKLVLHGITSLAEVQRVLKS